MRLELRQFDDPRRSMYVIYPEGERICCYENTLITVLRDQVGDDDIRELMKDDGLRELVDGQRFLILFPIPIGGSWNCELDAWRADDLADVPEMIRLFNYQPDLTDRGVYHNMHNARYYIGVGSGASMAYAIAACNPVNVAGVFGIGGSISARAAERCVGAAVPAILWNSDAATADFFAKLNRADVTDGAVRRSSINDSQFVLAEQRPDAALTPAAVQYGWEKLFSKVCRSNSCEYGDPGPRIVRGDYRFVIHEDDDCLGDGQKHTWFEYIPESVKANPEKKVPLMVYNHGGGDTPANLCNTSKMHEVAESDGFIVVYPWCTSKWGWNNDMNPEQYDDVGYIDALIKYMKKTYAIDETRVYIGGFSNGSAMSQVYAMTHPEVIAGVCADNTRFCQDRNVLPFAIAWEKKLKFDYRMPVWYTYGSRDVEYPVVRGSGQQVQYDFWKAYNNITCKPTPYISEPADCGVGVVGDKVEEYYPNPRYPDRKYTTHRFFSNDAEPLNLYNYSLADGKGHDCNPEEAWLSWNYVRQFRRLADGSLEVTG